METTALSVYLGLDINQVYLNLNKEKYKRTFDYIYYIQNADEL